MLSYITSVPNYLLHFLQLEAEPDGPPPTFSAKMSHTDVMDGNTAAAYIGYMCSDAAFIYPITPSSAASETYEEWAVQKKLNAFGQASVVRQLQSEAGAAGAVHGSLCVGALTTTFTSSQGLLLMIPPMYKIAGELLPCVFHVPARAIAGQALSIFGDHSDVMAVRQCGWAMMASCNQQEVMDLGLICHIATLKASVPFLHFYDGFRTSHEIQKIEVLERSFISHMLPSDCIQKFRESAMNPTHPYIKGTSQGQEVYFQNQELSNKYYLAVPGIVQQTMDDFARETGRRYNLCDYYGHPKAEHVIVIICSGAPVVHETIQKMIDDQPNRKVGLVVCRLYRPWPHNHFIKCLPRSVNRIAVLDRTKEVASYGEPLFMDVCTSIQQANLKASVVGGRYGLGSRDFTPPMICAVLANLAKWKPKHSFTVGIHDDVTNLSLDYAPFMNFISVPPGTSECVFWGMGSDGTVGANKNVIKIIGMNTPLKVQAYFSYSAYKAGGLTLSHLRFGPERVTSQYRIQRATYIACHRDQYIFDFNVVENIGYGGTFVLNCTWTPEQMDEMLPDYLKRKLADNDCRFYCINANDVAKDVGMGRRINSILMTVFFKVSGVLPFEEAITLFKSAIEKTYGKKGRKVVENNWKAVDEACNKSFQVFYDKAKWQKCKDISPAKISVDPKLEVGTTEHFSQAILLPAKSMAVESKPVSTFAGYVGGKLPMGTTNYEKRGIALTVPIVDMDKCTQCNYCAFVCPHAAIRPFLVDTDDAERAPEEFDMRKAKGMPEIAAYKYRIQVAPLDCTGCELCSIACPDEALTMTPLPLVKDRETEHWDFARSLAERSDLLPGGSRFTLKGSQFFTPMLEFSGACEGCGETPYVKLLTQMFGERLIIANATGCSSIWGASYPSNPYTVNEKGFGPAWGNSLFEDNAEYSFGMVVSLDHRRNRVKAAVEKICTSKEIQDKISVKLMDLLVEWNENHKNHDICQRIFTDASPLLEKEKDVDEAVRIVYDERDLLPRIIIWMVGGDGWAFDIGFGGLDHVLASGINVKCLVLDTEVYSNTGGQTSKATIFGAVHKFSAGGRTRNKKDLGSMMMEYGDIYVASCASSANMAQTVRCFLEADQYDGPALILAYAPCIEHNYIKPFNLQIEHSKLAVDCGYWPLYRFNPGLETVGENPFQLDAKKLKKEMAELFDRENRFKTLTRTNPEMAKQATAHVGEWAKRRHQRMITRAEFGDKMPVASGAKDDSMKVNILYGSETGNAEDLARRLGKVLKSRTLTPKVQGMDEIELDDLAEMKRVLIIISTAGQGDFPGNSESLWGAMKDAKDLSNVEYAVFGLGDSSYVYYNEAAKRFDKRLEELGAKRILNAGMGDDQEEEKYETALDEWWPDYLKTINAPEPKNVSDHPDPALFSIETLEGDNKYVPCQHWGTKFVEMARYQRLTPYDYEVEVDHLEFNLGNSGFKYQLGDSLALWPRNDTERVDEMCMYFGFNANSWVKIKKAGQEGSAKHEILFKNSLTIRQIFEECLDIFGKPNRGIYEHLWKYCTSEEDRSTAKSLLDNKEQIKTWTDKDTITIFDLMKKFPSCKPTLEQLIDFVPLLKPRYYSIASSQKYVGEKRLDLCIGIVSWTTDKGEQLGQCTGLVHRLAKKGETATLCAAIKATAFNLPNSETTPIIVAGMGTGIAPFRAFIQHKAYLKQQGKTSGPLVVYFGCRYSKMDWLYQSEMKQLESDGVITNLKLAFSRDQKEKVYIQHTIVQDPDLFYNRFITEGGFFYLCGSAKQVPIDIRKAVREVLQQKEGLSEEEAEEKITQMIIKGRYNVEAW